jgi:hypothetical protein
MKSFFKVFGIVLMIAAIGLLVVGCGGLGSENPEDSEAPSVPVNEKDPLTGTVTISKAVTVAVGVETMTLTADITGLDIGTATASCSYQWQREGMNISGATKKDYEITPTDYGKTIKVIVSHSSYTGSKEAQSADHTPTVCTLTLKWDAAAQKKDTYIVIERVDGSYWTSVGSDTSFLNIYGRAITLTSWTEIQFKMRTAYTMIGSEFFFQKDNAQGSDEFDLVNGTKSYTLTNVEDTFGVLTGLFATED